MSYAQLGVVIIIFQLLNCLCSKSPEDEEIQNNYYLYEKAKCSVLILSKLETSFVICINLYVLDYIQSLLNI